MRIVLTVTDGPHAGKAFSFTGHDTLLVGRSEEAHFRLSEEDLYFSRNHFLVEANPPQCCLLDMNSRNGTYVNGERVDRCELREGDEIQAGRTIIRVTFDDSDAAPSVPAMASTVPYKAPTDEARLPGPVSPGQASRPLPTAVSRTQCSACGAGEAQLVKGAMALCRECRAKAAEQPQPVAGYRVIEELGAGGMGLVALAVRVVDGLRLALKTVKPASLVRPQQVERFLREAKILSQLQHPNIVAFHDMGETNGLLWFAMDYVGGVDAHRLVRNEGQLPVKSAVDLACQLLDALTHAHERKFVHRDIKPSNLLIERTSEGDRLKLADFGLARVYQSSQLSGLTLSGEIGGTVGFMAPEQITDFREAEPSADLFSVAATLYTLLTAAYIYDLSGDLRARLLTILQDDPVPILERRRDIPKRLAAAIHRGLERAPHKRWQSAAAFRATLAPFMREG
jgi:serine/threonine-protein kinase